MRIALLSDIHGNAVALDSVLRALDSEGPVDSVVCLGDAAATGPRPREVLSALRSRGALCVMGNTDEWLLDPRPEAEGHPVKAIEEIELWDANRLDGPDREFLSAFEPTVRVEMGEGRSLLAFHGSPTSNTEWLDSAASAELLDEKLSGAGGATIMAGGHSHRQILRRHRGSILMNPGSVGLPYDRDPSTGRLYVPPWSEYALVTAEGAGLEVSFRRVPVDVGDLRASIASSGMPRADEFPGVWARYIELMLEEGRLS